LFVQFHDLNLFNIDKVFPDSNPPISGEIFSSLRIFIPADLFSVLLPGSDEGETDVSRFTHDRVADFHGRAKNSYSFFFFLK